jgi:3-methyladenine DNA glycosylase/8-oxoguanine DNA glycosylase
VRRTFPVSGALDLGRTVRGLATWGAATWVRVDATGAWYAARTALGPATVRMVREGDALSAEEWGPGAEALLERVTGLAGLEDDPAALVPRDAKVAECARTAPGYRIARSGTVYPTLVAAVLAQKVTGQESGTQIRRLAWSWGERAPGPRDDLWLLPAPRELADRSPSELHLLGVERMRGDRVREVAARAPWTSGVVLGEALGDPDAVPVGDYHLPDLVAWNLAREPRADDARMLELLEPYRGQRGRVVRLLKARGDEPPKWGPRSEARDIRDL